MIILNYFNKLKNIKQFYLVGSFTKTFEIYYIVGIYSYIKYVYI